MVVLFVSLSALGIDYNKITAQQKNILKNWTNGKNDRFPYFCTKK